MERSLSVLLPVRNAQSTLSEAVQDLLEVLPELTSQFEIIIIDDGSLDATIEIADELAAYYPQVKALRHSVPQGRSGAITTGLERSTGDIILLQDADCTVASDEICRLWQAIEAHEVVLGRPAQPVHWRWNRARSVGPEDRGGYLMLHRDAVAPIRPHLAQSHQLRQYLSGKQLHWHELLLRDRILQPNSQASGLRSSVSRGLAGLWSTTPQADVSQSITSKPRRPNYLHKLREFAAGE